MHTPFVAPCPSSLGFVSPRTGTGQRPVLALLAVLLLAAACPAWAAIHPLAGLAHNATNNLGSLDLTVSVEWNLDAAPTGTWNRSTYRNMVDSFAKSLFAVTEGRHRVRRVYTFMNKKEWDRADIRFVSNRSGRSEASVAAWRTGPGEITMYLKENATTRDAYIGPVMAHECGHYVYGIFDEYQDNSSKPAVSLKDKTSPASDDFEDMPSIMNRHADWPLQFSIAANYTDAEAKATAQYRAYQSSIWDTLVRSPSLDKEPGRSNGRVRYAAFGNVTAPAALTKPTAGYANTLRPLFMENATLNVLAFDPDLVASDWNAARRAAQGVVQALSVNSSLLAPVGLAAAIGKTTITGDAARAALSTRVSLLTASGSATLDAVLRAALANATAARALNQTCVVHLLAQGNPDVDAALEAEYQAAKVALNVPALAAGRAVGSPVASLAKLARASGGKYNRAKSAAELASKAERSASELEGDNTAVIAQTFADPLDSGQSVTMAFTAGTHDGAGDGSPDGILGVVFSVHPDDYATTTPTLTTPSGTVLTTASVAAGLTVVTDAAAGMRVFEIDPTAFAGGVSGTWQARIAAGAGMTDMVGLVAQAHSGLHLAVDVRQIEDERTPVVEAFLRLDRPVLGATVTADVYGPDGSLVAEGLALRDDGEGGDLRAEDGVYSMGLGAMNGDGEYDLVVTATNPEGTAVASSRGAVFSNPPETTAYAMGSFQRTAEATAALTVPSSQRNRGCVLNPSAPGGDWTLALMLAAVVGWAFSRGQKDRSCCVPPKRAHKNEE